MNCPCCGQPLTLPIIVEWCITAGGIEVNDIKLAVRAEVTATDKEIYNALGYLNRRGRIKRAGYGWYYRPSTCT